MKILAIDSSGLVASIAIVEDDTLLAEYTLNYKKTHSQTLLPMIDEVTRMTELELDTLDAIAVAGGPGSFTGLRIGSATAKGLGLSRQKITIETKHNNLIVYTEKTLKWALSFAREFREKGRCIEMLKRGASENKEKFREYGMRTQAVSMLYLQEDGTVELVNFRTGKEKTVDYGKERVTE